MQKLIYKVKFVTPAFLGGADQTAQWRTPPFKALLRQWWRVAYAPKVNYNITNLRQYEAALFGSASDETGTTSGKSHVRLRLSHWKNGGMQTWRGCGSVYHPEVRDGQNVGADLYLGYGPVSFRSGQGTVLGTVRDTGVQRTAIEPETEDAKLMIGVSDEYEAEIRLAMQLVAWFGTLGSRSRNGWGALEISPISPTPAIPPLTREVLKDFTRNLSRCLELDWAHAIGSDEKGPLVWRTTSKKGSWRDVIMDLARVKIAFRTALPLTTGHGQFQDRHLLAYPVTNHNVANWGNQARLANQLRFKVAKTGDNRWQGIIAHLPCALPGELARRLPSSPHKQRQIDIWQQVHAVLDGQNYIRRLI